MNDSDSEWDAFERQLRQIRPARPSDELMARFENPQPAPRISERSEFRTLVQFFVFGAGGAITLVALLSGWFLAHHAGAVFQTPLLASSTEAVVAARDEGIYACADGRTVEVIRLLDLRKSVWKDPRSGNRMEIVVPSQQFLVKNVETD